MPIPPPPLMKATRAAALVIIGLLTYCEGTFTKRCWQRLVDIEEAKALQALHFEET